jgi:hypothetical protein
MYLIVHHVLQTLVIRGPEIDLSLQFPPNVAMVHDFETTLLVPLSAQQRKRYRQSFVGSTPSQVGGRMKGRERVGQALSPGPGGSMVCLASLLDQRRPVNQLRLVTGPHEEGGGVVEKLDEEEEETVMIAMPLAG